LVAEIFEKMSQMKLLSFGVC